MARSIDDLKRLVENPAESLDTELKQWFEPQTAEGKAKIAKACIALFNNNGGTLIVGFTDAGIPEVPQPKNIRETFHTDIIQGIVGKYASQAIAIQVDYVEKEGLIFPVISIPSGVRTPCGAKSDLFDDQGKRLIRSQAIYVRTVSSNNLVSTSEPTMPDWDRIVRICHDNREADIGAFLRRQLASSDLEAIRRLINALANESAAAPEDLSTKTIAFLSNGKQHFDNAMRKRLGSPFSGPLFEVSVVIDGDFPRAQADIGFYRNLQLSKPMHSGWTFWIDSNGGANRENQPYILDSGWESLVAVNYHGSTVDFWRAEPIGHFYHARELEDDSVNTIKELHGKALDPLLHIGRVVEILSIAKAFAYAMGCESEKCSLGISCKWSGLEGRQIISWAHNERWTRGLGACVQQEETTFTAMPIESAALGAYAEDLVAPLVALFGGTKFDKELYESKAREVLQRRY